MMDWKYSTICMAIGIGCIAVGERLLEHPETAIDGIFVGAIGVGFVAVSQYLQEQGYKLKLRK